ncbi:hypothetical protein MRB53_038398 [Persea americana]|nr:hypothetical protein MRB53_038398 [Persea americana]
MTISEKISETSTSRQGFRRSSGGSRSGRRRFTKRTHHAASFSCWAGDDSSAAGRGSRAKCGRIAQKHA